VQLHSPKVLDAPFPPKFATFRETRSGAVLSPTVWEDEGCQSPEKFGRLYVQICSFWHKSSIYTITNFSSHLSKCTYQKFNLWGQTSDWAWPPGLFLEPPWIWSLDPIYYCNTLFLGSPDLHVDSKWHVELRQTYSAIHARKQTLQAQLLVIMRVQTRGPSSG